MRAVRLMPSPAFSRAPSTSTAALCSATVTPTVAATCSFGLSSFSSLSPPRLWPPCWFTMSVAPEAPLFASPPLSNLAPIARSALVDTDRFSLASLPSSDFTWSLFRRSVIRLLVSLDFFFSSASLAFLSKIEPVVRLLARSETPSVNLETLFRLRCMSAPIALAKDQVSSMLRLCARTSIRPAASTA